MDNIWEKDEEGYLYIKNLKKALCQRCFKEIVVEGDIFCKACVEIRENFDKKDRKTTATKKRGIQKTLEDEDIIEDENEEENEKDEETEFEKEHYNNN